MTEILIQEDWGAPIEILPPSGIWIARVRILDYILGITKVKNLVISEHNIRKTKPLEGIEKFSRHLKVFKLLHYPWSTSDGEVYEGGRRVRSLQQADPERHIICVIEDKKEEYQKLFSMAGNIFHVMPVTRDLARTCRELKQQGWTARAIAKYLGISDSTVHDWCLSDRLPPTLEEVKTEVEKLPTRRAKPVMSILEEVKDKETAIKVVKMAKEVSSERIRSIAHEVKRGIPLNPELEVQAMKKKGTEYLLKTLPFPIKLFNKIAKYAKYLDKSFPETVWYLCRRTLKEEII